MENTIIPKRFQMELLLDDGPLELELDLIPLALVLDTALFLELALA